MFEDVQAICPFARIEQGAAPNPIDQRRIAVEQRIDYWKTAGQGVAAFRGLQVYVDGCGLEHSLLELVKTRASQINGCAYCIDMHTKDARSSRDRKSTRLNSSP